MKKDGVRFHLALDSGAHSIYRKFIARKEGRYRIGSDSVSVRAKHLRDVRVGHLTSKEYRAYVDSYVEFVHSLGDRIDFHVSLDIIFDAKASYESHLYLESCGLKPMPVVHYGEDLKWLKKYMDRYEYLGIGGLGQSVSKSAYFAFADKVFSLLSDKRGVPQWRTHGFAIASHNLLTKYPWYSTDASSPFYLSRHGTLTAPRPIMRRGEVVGFDFLKPHQSFPITVRRRAARYSYWSLSPMYKSVLDLHFKNLGVTLEQLQEYKYRDAANLYFYKQAAVAIQKARAERLGEEYPFKIYISGKPGAGEEAFLDSLGILKRMGIEDFYYLGTYFLPQPFKFFLDRGMTKGRSHENQRPRLRS